MSADLTAPSSHPLGRRVRSPLPSAVTAPRGVYAVGRTTVATAATVLVLIVAWALAATWFILFRDDVAAHLVREQAAARMVYEERLAGLRARLDRVASQKLLEQDGVDGQVAALVARQVELENRHAVLASLAETAVALPAGPKAKEPAVPVAAGRGRPTAPVGGPIAAMPQEPVAASAYAPLTKPTPVPDPIGLRLRDDGPPGPRAAREEAAPERLAALGGALGRIEAAQLGVLDGLLASSREQVARLRSAVAEAGLDPDRLEVPGGVAGGPLVPLPARAQGPFAAGAGQAQVSLAELARLRRASAALPFARPMAGDHELTSGFGYRLDPFTRGPAMHTGIDFRAEHGAAARAAGGGRVVTAEYSGGYGNLVEVEHASGVTSRYAHLSAIAVSVGQTVEAGAVLGRVGSTGRSTGPHLHYEIRVDGDAVDPQRFLRAGARHLPSR